MPTLRDFHIRIGAVVIVAVGFLGGPAGAQEQSEPDAAAARAFKELMDAYRKLPAVEITAELKIELIQADADAEAESDPVKAVFTAAGPTRGIVTLNGFTCTFGDGAFNAVHEQEEHSYYAESFEGAPYWLLWDAFRDLPFPHIALLWGDEESGDVWMELHPQTPWLVPSAVVDEEIEAEKEKEKKKPQRRLTLTSPNATLQFIIDPKTMLVQRAVHEITGGDFVEPGVTKRTTYTYTHVAHDKPLPAEQLAFDPEQRQRVDMFAALAPRLPVAPDVQLPGAGEAVVGNLIGQPAPSFVLATAEGGAVDLEDLRGKIVVLDFWATWCGPCRAVLPKLHKVEAWARLEALPVTILTVNVWQGRNAEENTPDARLESVRTFWRKAAYTLPVAMDYTDETAAAYGVQGIPATFVIRSDGTVHAGPTLLGEADYEAALKLAIRGTLDILEEVPAPEETP